MRLYNFDYRLQPILRQEKDFPWPLFKTSEFQHKIRPKRGGGGPNVYRKPHYVDGNLNLLFCFLNTFKRYVLQNVFKLWLLQALML